MLILSHVPELNSGAYAQQQNPCHQISQRLHKAANMKDIVRCRYYRLRGSKRWDRTLAL